MATYNKFNALIADAFNGVHDFSTDTFKFMLTLTAPVATNSVKTDLTEIAAGNGYTAGGTAVAITSSTQTSGTLSVVPTADVVFTATGTVADFRYVVLYNDTAVGDNLISWWDRGSTVSLQNTDTFTVDVGATLFTAS